MGYSFPKIFDEILGEYFWDGVNYHLHDQLVCITNILWLILLQHRSFTKSKEKSITVLVNKKNDTVLAITIDENTKDYTPGMTSKQSDITKQVYKRTRK